MMKDWFGPDLIRGKNIDERNRNQMLSFKLMQFLIEMLLKHTQNKVMKYSYFMTHYLLA